VSILIQLLSPSINFFFSLLPALQELIPKIVAGLTKELTQKSPKTRVGAFALLKELVAVRPGLLTNHIQAVVPGVIFSLGVSVPLFSKGIQTKSLLLGQGHKL
jgi:hypothetical protein